MLSKQCKLHLEEVGQTPIQHMKKAIIMAVKLQLLVPALLIHSVAPRFFKNTATDAMKGILKDRND
jgi:hypothetical protein